MSGFATEGAAAGRLASFSTAEGPGYGVVAEDGMVVLSHAFGDRWPTLREAIADNGLDRLLDHAAGRRADLAPGSWRWEIPVPAPEKILCVGVNFPDRNAEYKDGQEAPPNPSLFVRFPRSFTGHDRPLIRPPESPQMDYEGEIVIVIGKGGRRIPERAALDHVAALSLANEGTIRDWVRHAKFNVTQGKNFDRTGSIGPWLVPFRSEEQLADIELSTTVNGEVRQRDRTGRMLFPFRKIISYVSTFTTLVPGDVILTGTPTGAGARFDPPVWLRPGDTIEVTAGALGVLRNGVADEGSPDAVA